MKVKITTYDPPINGADCYYIIEHYDADGKLTGESYCGISKEQAAEQTASGVYIDDDATRWLWWRNFNSLTDTDKKAVAAVFPDIESKDAAKLKPPHRIAYIAREKIRKEFGETCARCCGSGSYATSRAYTLVDNGVCHKCGGTGKQLPRLTAKKLDEIKAFFGGAK